VALGDRSPEVVVSALQTMPERRRFLRGMVAWVGYEQVPIEYIARVGEVMRQADWHIFSGAHEAARQAPRVAVD